MNLENFIARRIAFSKDRNFTAVIVKIAIVAVSLSLAVMIIATATISGFKRDITNKIFGFWGHIHITDANISRTFEAIAIERDSVLIDQILNIESITYQQPKSIFGIPLQNAYKEVSTSGGVKNMYGFALAPTILNTKEEFEGLIIRGVDSSFCSDVMDQFMIEGESIQFQDSTASDDLVISRTTARRLDISTGDKVLLNFIRKNQTFKRRFTVSGIYKTGLEEYDIKFAIADIRKIQEALGWEVKNVAGYELFLDDIEDLKVINEYIYLDVLPSRLYAETIEEKFPGIFEWLKIQNSNEIVILGLMTFVSILTMITALLILIIEKTNMIGVLKSIGASDWSIRKIFLYQAGVILLQGAFWGNLTGLGICFLQKYFKLFKLNEEVYYLSEAPIHIDWLTIVLLNGGVLLVILACMIIPSALISRISPVRSLRFK
jgi:lipoprotein-releasing system permease protein